MGRPTIVTRCFMRIVSWSERLNLAFSTVGNPPIYDNAVFPWTCLIEKEWCPIRAELGLVLTRKDELPAFHELATDVSTISRDHGWKSFILAAYGFRSANNIGLCPQTWRIRQNIPGLISVMYSIMEPPPWSLQRSAAASSRSDCSGATRHARHPGRKRSVPVAQGRGRHFR
jgi:ornithine lipid ester-linked acyl 2-hydroxylase